ncbi:MAG: AAA family ATPase, partial [Lachnospiraceae bacterium]|nr:AAA family ATPase [Lachnospiraceae bacterium]
MDTKIIFIGNYKGGVGKTTSVLNFAEYFSKADKKVLALDIDPQSSLSEILVANGNFGSLSDLPERETLNYIFDLYISKIKKYNAIELKFDSVMIKRYKDCFDFVPSSLFYRKNVGLDALALMMEDDIQYLSILKNWIDTVKNKYDI